MGNIMEMPERIFICHSCKKRIYKMSERIELKHGSDWESVCDKLCLAQWLTKHDYKGYCCDPKMALHQPLLPKKVSELNAIDYKIAQGYISH